MLLALFLALLSPSAQAAPYSLGARLVQILPEGYSEGVTEKGAPCRVVFSWNRGPGSGPNYARMQVIAEPDGNLLDIELFFKGYRGKAHGHWGKNQVSVRYRQSRLSATRGPNGLFVKVSNKSQKASCLLKAPAKPAALTTSG